METRLRLKQCEVVRYEDEFGHSYEIDGEMVAGVTTILSLGVPHEQGLLEWFKRNDKDAQEEILKDAQERGTNVHQAIEMLLLGGKVIPDQFKRPREKKAIAAFLDFAQTVNLDPSQVTPEQVVAFVDGNMKFAGTLDLLATINGKRLLIDFKTSAAPSKKNNLQVKAYQEAVEQSYNEKIDDSYVLYLGTSHKGTKPRIDENSLPSNGRGWQLIKSTDTFEDFKRAYDMALFMNGGYPRPPKVEAYPEYWQLFERETNE